MIVVMKADATRAQIAEVETRLREMGYRTHPICGDERTVIGAVGVTRADNPEVIGKMAGVDRIVPIMKPYKLVSREFNPVGTKIRVGDAVFGGGEMVVIAGPCAVEGEEMIHRVAQDVKRAGASVLRGGAFKPRTSPYAFQGLELEGLSMLRSAGKAANLPVVTEVMDTRDVEMVSEYADIIQVGARNMQNFKLLKELGHVRKPVLLKRGLAATLEEWLMAAEYILDGGNDQVILCERGIRTYESATRNTLDLSAVPLCKEFSHLPLVVDPSHGTGLARLVLPMSRAAAAVGADGIMVEVHPDPIRAMVDGQQSITPAQLSVLVTEVKRVSAAVRTHPQVASGSCKRAI
ncbi:MAG: 3-deoxy-7-phosphoheptulonate synthase [Bacillota bacterium]